MLLSALIIILSSIIIYKIIIFIYEFSFKNIEGMENQEYEPYNTNDPNNCLILAQQNAGNIEYLKTRMNDVTNVKSNLDTMRQDMQTMQVQIDSLLQQQSDMAVELSGGEEPIAIDGLDDGEDTEEIIEEEEDENL